MVHEFYKHFEWVYFDTSEHYRTALSDSDSACSEVTKYVQDVHPACERTLEDARRSCSSLSAAFREKFLEFLARCFVASLANRLVHSHTLSISSNPRGRSRRRSNLDLVAAMVAEYGARLYDHRIWFEEVAKFRSNSAQ